MAAVRTKTDTMQALILQEPGSLSLRETRIPEPGPGEILVRVKAATTCGTDLKAFLRGHPQIPMPGVFGHEYSGVVSAAGPNAPFKVGDEIMGVHSAPCRECRWCRRDQENLCETIMATKVLGSYAEFLLVPSRIAAVNVFLKPGWVSFDRAAFLEPLACVAQALDEAKPSAADDVLIIGPGALGLMFVAALKHQGIEGVTLAGRNKARLKIGESLGAKISSLSNLEGEFDVVIECTGKVEVWERSLGSVRRGGKLVLFGGCPSGSSARFDTGRVHYGQVNMVSPFHFGTKAVKTARSWLLDPMFDVSPLISGERLLSEAESVFHDLEAGRGVKYVFRP